MAARAEFSGSGEVMIACNTLRTEIEHVMEQHGVKRPVVWLESKLHNVPANIECMDSLSSNAKKFKGFDVVLTNPPFGTKKGGERPTRDDISFQTSNKQLNFLQVIYRSLKTTGNGSAGSRREEKPERHTVKNVNRSN